MSQQSIIAKLGLILLFALNYNTVYSQILFSEDFENGMPNGWTIETNASDGGWLVGSPSFVSSTSFNLNSGSEGLAASNDDLCDCDKLLDVFITPPIDLSEVTDVVLKFDSYYNDGFYEGSQEQATVEISTDGENWTILEDIHGHGFWDQHIVDVSDYASQTVYFAFTYSDDEGWMYGFAIDNVIVEVPLVLQIELTEVNERLYGEVNKPFPISGTILNSGQTAITSMEVNYYIDGALTGTELFEDLLFEPFTYNAFELTDTWFPPNTGNYEIEIQIVAINEIAEEIISLVEPFETQILEEIIVPNKILAFLVTQPNISIIADASNSLDRPTDLDFFPVLGKNELWITNQETESEGGTTVTISNATTEERTFESLKDGNSWHFMSLPTGIAFSDDNFNFATSPGVQDANHGDELFTGPTLWSSHPEIYAQPSGGNGSHLDMLHGSPFSMGIAHEKDNVFWVYDNWHEEIVRYDFVRDHGPGNADHSDGRVHRYPNMDISMDQDIPNHMIMDKETEWLYFVDNGQSRVMRLDINSATGSAELPEYNEPLAEHLMMAGFTYETIIEEGLSQPCGIELFENFLLVGDYANGDIIVYDLNNEFNEVGRIVTGEAGLTGIKIGPEGNIWATNRTENTLLQLSPAESILPIVNFNVTIEDALVTVENTSVLADTWSLNWGDNSDEESDFDVISHEFTENGLFDICLTAQNEDGTGEYCLTIEISSIAPVAMFDYTIAEETVIVFDASTNVDSWSWTWGDDTENGAGLAPGAHQYEFNGEYEICLTVENIAGTDQLCQTIEIVSGVNVGLTDLAVMHSLDLYPNPTSGQLNLSFNLKENQSLNISIYELLGQEVKEVADRDFNQGKNTLNIDTEQFSNGLYFLQVTSNSNKIGLPFVVER